MTRLYPASRGPAPPIDPENDAEQTNGELDQDAENEPETYVDNTNVNFNPQLTLVGSNYHSSERENETNVDQSQHAGCFPGQRGWSGDPAGIMEKDGLGAGNTDQAANHPRRRRLIRPDPAPKRNGGECGAHPCPGPTLAASATAAGSRPMHSRRGLRCGRARRAHL
jgi:hypothetical protein